MVEDGEGIAEQISAGKGVWVIFEAWVSDAGKRGPHAGLACGHAMGPDQLFCTA
jgi:hypothetical protein